MFADCEIELRAPYEAAVARLAQVIDHNAWHTVSEPLYERGLEAVLRVGPFGASRGLSTLVTVQALPPVSRGATTHVALRWVATGRTGDLFPTLDADLVLTSDGDDRSRLRLVGSYRPPLGWAGVVLDRAVMHHIAKATIRALLRELADLITARPCGDPDPRVPLAATSPGCPTPVIDEVPGATAHLGSGTGQGHPGQAHATA